jgi:hypothetical protein
LKAIEREGPSSDLSWTESKKKPAWSNTFRYSTTPLTRKRAPRPSRVALQLVVRRRLSGFYRSRLPIDMRSPLLIVTRAVKIISEIFSDYWHVVLSMAMVRTKNQTINTNGLSSVFSAKGQSRGRLLLDSPGIARIRIVALPAPGVCAIKRAAGTASRPVESSSVSQ